MIQKTNAPVQALNHETLNCLSCGEAIFNPICPYCIAEEFKNWIKEYPSLEKEVIPRINKFLENHKQICNHTPQICIVCNHNTAYLCPYCFTEFLLEILKIVNAEESALGEFLFIFNYDFDHTGYYKEGEKLGVF